MITISDIMTIYGIGSAIYTHRNRLINFLIKYKLGRVFLGIVFAPFIIVVLIIWYDLYKKHPELLTKYNAQKKISDFT